VAGALMETCYAAGWVLTLACARGSLPIELPSAADSDARWPAMGFGSPTHRRAFIRTARLAGELAVAGLDDAHRLEEQRRS
jgi:hypothetical protein